MRPQGEMEEQTKRLNQLATLEGRGAQCGVSLSSALSKQAGLKPNVTSDQLRQLIVSSTLGHNAAAKDFLIHWAKLIQEAEKSRKQLLPSAQRLSAEGLPKGNPESSSVLEERMLRLESLASACGVSFEAVTEDVRQRVTKEQLRGWVRSDVGKERIAASLLLDRWTQAIQRKQATVQQVQGATPKITTPPSPQQPKLVNGSESEILGLTQEQRQCVLNRHNDWRLRCGSEPLSYDMNLEAHAQQWANDLAGRRYWGPSPHNANRTLPMLSGDVGENIARGKGSGAIGAPVEQHLQSSVDDWAMEFKAHNFTTHKSQGTGHFTQVVWRATKKMGCGFARIVMPEPGGWYWVCVCNYHPSGNVVSLAGDPYQLYAANVSKPQALQ